MSTTGAVTTRVEQLAADAGPLMRMYLAALARVFSTRAALHRAQVAGEPWRALELDLATAEADLASAKAAAGQDLVFALRTAVQLVPGLVDQWAREIPSVRRLRRRVRRLEQTVLALADRLGVTP